MTTPHQSFSQRMAEVKARQRQEEIQITRDSLAHLDSSVMRDTEEAVNAVRTRMADTEPTAESLADLAEAAATAARLLDYIAKVTGVQAAELGAADRAVASRLRISTKTLTNWKKDGGTEVPTPPEDAWWVEPTPAAPAAAGTTAQAPTEHDSDAAIEQATEHSPATLSEQDHRQEGRPEDSVQQHAAQDEHDHHTPEQHDSARFSQNY